MKIHNYKIRPLTNDVYPEECLCDQADFFGVYKLQPDNTEDWIADFDTQEAAIEFIYHIRPL